MNEINAVKAGMESDMMRNILNCKYAPLAITVFGILGSLAIFEYFDKAGKGMELGYNTSMKSNKYGELCFTKSSDYSKPENDKTYETTNSNLEN